MNRRFKPVFGLIAWCALMVPAVDGQIFHPQAGSSSLMGAHGGSLGFEAPGYSGALGAGFVNGQFEVGGIIRTTFKGYDLFLGDDTVRFGLPTDVFANSYYFVGRGIGISKKSNFGSFTSFAGTSSEFVGTNFFQAARTKSPLFGTFAEYKLSSNLTFTSDLVLGNKQTLIGGLAFRPKIGTLFAMSGGFGANSPYMATAMKFERSRYDFKASYIATDRGFRRSSMTEPVMSEPDRDNEEFTFRLTDRASFTLGRQNLLAPVSVKDVAGSRATVHQITANYSFHKFLISGGVFESRVDAGGQNVGESLRVARSLTRKIDVGFDYNRNTFQSTTNSSWSTNVRENFTRQISLIQYVNRSAGQTSFSFGGELRTRRITIGVTNDTTYVPFRPQSAGGPFVRAYNVRLSIQPFRSFTLQANTNVDPAGKLRYTTYVGDYLYRYEGLQGAGSGQRGQAEASFAKYVVSGKVVDPDGNPIAGAALQIGTDLVFTNSEGEFILRTRKRQSLTFHVSMRDFLTNDFYEVVTAPSEVQSELEDKASPVTVTLRKIDRQLGMRLLAEAESKEHPTEQKTEQKTDQGSAVSSSQAGGVSSSKSTGGALPQP